MNAKQIQDRLEAAGCQCELRGNRVIVKKTKNGAFGYYGYCIAGEDIWDITTNITKRAGEISAILRKEVA